MKRSISRSALKLLSLSLVGVLPFVLASSTRAQSKASPGKANPAPDANGHVNLCVQPGSNTDECVTDELDLEGPGGPAPVRDLTGVWAGHTNSGPRGAEWPSLTPLGEKIMSEHHASSKVGLAKANDPFDKCDPLGFPRVLMQQTRGIMFAKMPDRVLMLRQYDQVWREIWTDGRALPKDIGGTSKDSPDPRWYGYSAGHWEDDYTFVVNSTGSDDRSWLDFNGHPHSVSMQIEERYHRPDHNTLDLTITMVDPTIYTKPIIAHNHFRWVPKQELEQQICVSSEAILYHHTVVDEAVSTGASPAK
jgi:hypothetical protein